MTHDFDADRVVDLYLNHPLVKPRIIKGTQDYIKHDNVFTRQRSYEIFQEIVEEHRKEVTENHSYALQIEQEKTKQEQEKTKQEIEQEKTKQQLLSILATKEIPVDSLTLLLNYLNE